MQALGLKPKKHVAPPILNEKELDDYLRQQSKQAGEAFQPGVTGGGDEADRIKGLGFAP